MNIENAKIGLVCLHSFSDPGGVQNHVLALYKEYARRGMKVKIVAPGSAKPQGFPQEDIINIGVSKHISGNSSKTDFSVSFRRAARKRIREEKFDILHFHNLGHGPLALQILAKSNSLHVLTVHAAADATITAKFPFVFFTRLYLQRAYGKRFHGLIGVSPAAMETIKKFGGFHNGPARIISNGVDLSAFSTNLPLLERFKDAKRNLLFVGRFEKRKGLMYLLRAYEMLVKQRDDLRLIIVGDGDGRREAENFVRAKRLPDVFFEGYVASATLPRYYRTADIFCAPSIYGESFGITLLEAMACDAPIAGFANPGYSWVMAGHEQYFGVGVLAKPKDEKELAQKILFILENPEIANRAREWGLRRCQEFSWQNIADEVINFYKEVGEYHGRSAIGV